MSTTVRPIRVLISGGGIAGSVFASCLLRAIPSASIKLVERASQLRLTGASVDVRNAAVDIVKWMGVEPDIRKNATGETGIAFVNRNGHPIATFGATGRTDVQSMTSEYEIFRGTLAKIFLEPILNRIQLVLNDHVTGYQQDENEIRVTFASNTTETFDLVVAADGLNSRIRGLMLGKNPRDHIHDEGVYAAYFTINEDLLGGSSVARWRNLSRGRCIFLRPDPAGRTRAMLMTIVEKKDVARRAHLRQALADGPEAYKQLMEYTFRDGDWLTPRVLQGMKESDDFYCSPFAQVRSPILSDRRVVLVGDAGFATPAIGTSLAIIGGYVLAGEICRSPEHITDAVARYQEHLQDFVKTQQSDDHAMQWLNPQTELGICLRNAMIWLVTKTGMDQLVMRVAGYFDRPWKLPEYPWPDSVRVEKR